MDGKTAVAWILLGGVGLYLLYRTYRPVGGEIADALSLFDPFFAPGPPMQDLGGIRQYTPAPGPGNEPLKQATPASTGTRAAGAISAGGGAVAAGLSGAAAVATAGIAAAAALLVWGISEKGWFRGGEEALKVNPARDEYFDTFRAFDPYQGMANHPDPIRNPSGFYGHAWLLNEMGAENGPLPQIGRAYGDSLHAAVTKADTMEEFIKATQNVIAFLQRYPQRTASLEAYARSHFGAVAA